MKEHNTNSFSAQWTKEQRSFWTAWQNLIAGNRIAENIPRAPWPEENTETLDTINISRSQYYRSLTNQHFSKQEIIIELGADCRSSWSDYIDSSRHTLVKSSWSLRDSTPDIWQIPVQQLISVLDSQEFASMTEQITTIILENTLDCLPISVIQMLVRFAKKYNIRLIALKFRPLSAPDIEQIKTSAQQHLIPNKDCPSVLMAAKELLHIMQTKVIRPDQKSIFYMYRPPIGSPIIIPYSLQNNPSNYQLYQSMLKEVSNSNGAVKLVPFTPDITDMTDQNVPAILGKLVLSLLSLHNRPKTSYGVQMKHSSIKPQITMVQAWLLGLQREANKEEMSLNIHLDSFGTKSTNNLLHTANGELINPKEFIDEWTKRGFPINILRKYAYGRIGDPIKSLPVNNHWLGEREGLIFQVTRIEITPNR
jgi:hypothetical protein